LEDAAFDVFGGERAPEAAVEAVGGVVAQDEVVIGRHGEVGGQVQHLECVSRRWEVKDFACGIAQGSGLVVDIQAAFLDAYIITGAMR
jgi:hypothetical protein